jgi:hypothetical protein
MNDLDTMYNDQGIVEAALSIARTVRDDVPAGRWVRSAVLPGIGATITAMATRMDHTAAAAELKSFGDYVAHTFDNDDLDGLIDDYLVCAQTLVGDDRYFD